MRKRLFPPVSILALVFLAIAGCGKDKDPDPPAKTNTEKITQSSWKIEKAEAGGLDVTSNAQLACYLDNAMTFATNLSGTITEGAVVCTSPAPATFTWSFQNNEALLRFSFTLFPGGSPDFTIVSLTETNLVLSQQMTIPPFPATTVVVTFKH